MSKTFRTAGWLAVMALLGAALVAPAAVSAADPVYATVTGHEAFSKDANKPGYWGEDCTKLDDVGQVDSYVLENDYDLVIVKAGSGAFANTLFEGASAGETVWADTNGNNTFDPGGQGGDKQISHIIFCGPTQEESQPVESQPDESQPDESQPDESQPDESQPDESQPEGSVLAQTGTPEEDVTPPSTDTLTATGSTPSNTSWQLVLIAMAALLATVLILTPAERRSRR